MADILAFTLIGNTTELDCSTTSASVTLPDTGNSYGGGNYRLVNDGPDKVFIAIGTGAVTAAIPVNGTPANGMPMEAGTTEVFGFPPGATLAAICPSSTAKLYITGGQGT